MEEREPGFEWRFAWDKTETKRENILRLGGLLVIYALIVYWVIVGVEILVSFFT